MQPPFSLALAHSLALSHSLAFCAPESREKGLGKRGGGKANVSVATALTCGGEGMGGEGRARKELCLLQAQCGTFQGNR